MCVVTLNATDGKISFDRRMPQIERSREFHLRVGAWDGSIERVTLSNFRSLVFDHFVDGFIDGKDTLDIKIEIESNGPPAGYELRMGGPHKFPFDKDRSRVPPGKHRLLEYELEMKRPGEKAVMVDPCWDEKP